MQNIFETFEFIKIKDNIKEYSRSELGKQYIDELDILPLDLMLENLEDLKEMMSLVIRYGSLPISNSASCLYLIDLAKKTAILTPHDISLIAEDILTSIKINKFLSSLGSLFPRIKLVVDSFYDLSTLEKEIHRIISPSLTIFDHASVELTTIRHKLKVAESSLQGKINNLAFKYSSYLNDENITIRDGHFVLPVKTSDKSKVIGIVHDISTSGQTTFIEPLEIVESNNLITSLKVEEKEEIRRILKVLTARILLSEKEIINNNRLIAKLDFLYSKASYGLSIDGEISTFSKEGKIELIDAKHPLIDKNKVISNSYFLNEDKRIVVISGPNAGGKTVSLKTVGLLILMNQCGLALPVRKACLSYFNHIYIDIGDNQSLSDNLSTFSAHMNQVGEILSVVKGKDLVLFDELGTGTSPLEGEALAISILKYLEKKHAFALISSHFEALKEYAFLSTNIENASMIFDEDKLIPTYRYNYSSPGRSYAFVVAKRYGMVDEIIKEAEDYLSKKGDNNVSDLLEVLQKQVEENVILNEKLTRKDKELFRKTQELDNKEKLLETKRNKLLEDVQEEKKRIIDNAKKSVNEIISLMQKGDLKLHEVIELKSKLDDLQEKEETVIYNEQIEVNDYVSIPSIGLSGLVIKIKNKKAHINSDTGMSVDVDISKLHKIDRPKIGTKVSKSFHYDDLIKTNVGLELNIIGKHLDEAKECLIKYLDECQIKHFSTVRIIHGFGSGALRKMVREYLSSLKGVSFRSGDMHEGGGGATVVIFKK